MRESMIFNKILLLSLSVYAFIGIESVMAACYSSAAGEYCLTNKRYTCPAGCYCGSASEPDGALDKKGNKQKDIYQDEVAAWCKNGSSCPWSAGGGQCGTSDKAKVFRCPANFSFSDNGAKTIENCYTHRDGDYKKPKLYYKKITCSAGQYLPKNSDSCTSCKDDTGAYCPGVKNVVPSTSIDQGLNICPDKQKPNSERTACEDTSIHFDAGQYLPANSTSCVACKDKSYACTGGKFYQESFDQGITTCGDGYAQNDDKTQCIYVADTDYNCEVGYYLPAHGTKCERCASSKKYCPGGTFHYYDLDQGIYTCPYTSVANSDRSACVLRLSQDSMKYGPNGANAPLSEQCWNKKTREDYTRCIYSEKDTKLIQPLLKKPLANVGILDNIIDIKNTNRSLPMATPEDKASKFRNAPVVIEKNSVVQALVDSVTK